PVLERDARASPLARVRPPDEDPRADLQPDGVRAGEERRPDDEETENREGEDQRGSTKTVESEDHGGPGVREPCRAFRSGARLPAGGGRARPGRARASGCPARSAWGGEAFPHATLRLTGLVHLQMIAPRC